MSMPPPAKRLPQLPAAAPQPALATHAVLPGAIEQAIPHEAIKLSQHPQDDRPPPDRVQAADPAHLSDRRHQSRRAAQAPRRAQQGPRKPRHEAQRQRPADQGARPVADRSARVQRQLRRRPALQIQPRRHLGRGVDPRGPDHADHRRRGEQERLGDLDRNEGPRRPRPRRQAPAAGISGRHRQPLATWACTASRISRR